MPILRAGRSPFLIQRRIVSGSFPALLAASGTVIIARYYYNQHSDSFETADLLVLPVGSPGSQPDDCEAHGAGGGAELRVVRGEGELGEFLAQAKRAGQMDGVEGGDREREWITRALEDRAR